MQNMKKKLSGLTTFTFATVAGVSTVACQNEVAASMNSKVLTDLGLYGPDDNSQVEVVLDVKDGEVSWSSDKLNNLTAANLLRLNNCSI